MLADQLRAAVEASGQTTYEVAKGSELSYPVLFRFMKGERDLKLDTAGKIAAYLGLHLAPAKRKGRR